jgi:hypothetical protein
VGPARPGARHGEGWNQKIHACMQGVWQWGRRAQGPGTERVGTRKSMRACRHAHLAPLEDVKVSLMHTIRSALALS